MMKRHGFKAGGLERARYHIWCVPYLDLRVQGWRARYGKVWFMPHLDLAMYTPSLFECNMCSLYIWSMLSNLQ